ncbi:hypothetical protein [Streptomyces sp. NRRL F-5630]|uniref:hypothetical protein n=1 Tax=Streptomyces sp. NRRL F-5630 TaxID=1463864 RepID=UPI003D756AD8
MGFPAPEDPFDESFRSGNGYADLSKEVSGDESAMQGDADGGTTTGPQMGDGREDHRFDAGRNSSAAPEADGLASGTSPVGHDDDPVLREAQRALRAAVAELRQEALFNFGEMTAVKLTAVLGQLLDHSELPHRYLKTVRAVFAEPVGYRAAYKALEEPGAVLVLPREPGAGRTFTAHALLADLHLNNGARVGPLSFGGTARFPLRLLPRERNAGYLLDLPADEDGTVAVSSDFGALLHDIRLRLKGSSSRLIVLTTPEQWQRIRGGAPEGVVPRLGKPDPVDVARTWLSAEAPELDTSRWLADARIQELLAGRPPSDVLQTVGLIIKATQASQVPWARESASREQAEADPDGFNARVLSVIQARADWRKELLNWHKKPGRTDFQRNFLLVAALFRSATVAHVYVKAADLCGHFGTPLALEGQVSPGVLEMVDKIGADLHPVNDTLDFGRPGWDDAVLSYFWIDRPAARKTFLAWMAEAPTTKRKSNEFLESFTTDDRLLLANRIGTFAVRWAARHRKPDPLVRIISAWHGDQILWNTATELISAAALHPTMGRFIHELLLHWSKNKEDAALPKLAVDVCAGEFGRLYTNKALLRLGYAAGSEDPGVQKSLHGAVRVIWSDPTARKILFDSIISWCAPNTNRLASGRRSFAALATLTADQNGEAAPRPVLLQENGEADDFQPALKDLSVGWRTLLASADNDAEPAEALRLWMDAAHQRPDLRPMVFSVLRGALDASEPDLARRLRNRLNDLLYAWQPYPAPDSDATRVQLRHELADLLAHDRSRSVTRYHPRVIGRSTETA